jgi:hypothetical protein
MSTRKVVIAPTVYTNGETGATSTSTTYHYAESKSCVDKIRDPRETDEATAKLFGRTLCAVCAGQEAKANALTVALEAVGATTLPAAAEELGDGYEVRVYWTAPGAKTPSILWRSSPPPG